MTKNSSQLDAAVILAALQDEAKPLLKQLQKISITDNESYQLKAAKVGTLKALGKIAAEKEKSLTTPLRQVIDDIRDLFSPFRKLVAEAESAAKMEMVRHVERAELQKAKVKADLESGKIAKLSTAVRKSAELEVTSSAASVRKIWDIEEVDVTLTPREFLIPDRAKIKEALKAGQKVAGWKYVQKTSIAV